LLAVCVPFARLPAEWPPGLLARAFAGFPAARLPARPVDPVGFVRLTDRSLAVRFAGILRTNDIRRRR